MGQRRAHYSLDSVRSSTSILHCPTDILYFHDSRATIIPSSFPEVTQYGSCLHWFGNGSHSSIFLSLLYPSLLSVHTRRLCHQSRGSSSTIRHNQHLLHYVSWWSTSSRGKILPILHTWRRIYDSRSVVDARSPRRYKHKQHLWL